MLTFISTLEFGGGLLLILGLGSRLIALLLAIDMRVAYIAADRAALFSMISNPDKFTTAAPYAFLIASLLALIFGPGKASLDTLFAGRGLRSQIARARSRLKRFGLSAAPGTRKCRSIRRRL